MRIQQHKNVEQLEAFLKKEPIHSCHIYYKDNIVYEYYKDKTVEEKVSKVNSVTKSVLSILIGIAVDRGEIKDITLPLSSFYEDLDKQKGDITIEQLLTMTAGFEWKEWGKYGSMPEDEDWISFVLNKKITSTPGDLFVYSSGCSQLLSDILEKSTNMSASLYAEKYLFHPLGITEYIWDKDSNGIAIGGFGLQLKPKDLLKIGILMLHKGEWNGSQIVSSEWVETSTTRKVATKEKTGAYAYHWWNINSEKQLYTAIGFGGQIVFVNPTDGYVVVCTGNLSKRTMRPIEIIKTVLLK